MSEKETLQLLALIQDLANEVKTNRAEINKLIEKVNQLESK